MSEAQVGIARAALERAELDLSFTTVRAPIAGRASMWNVEVGGLVGSGEPTLLATIYDDSRIYCYFDVTEYWLLEVRRIVRETLGRKEQPGDVPLEMGLTNEEGFPHHGVIDYGEPTIDPDTGTLRVRGIFENPEQQLVSGAFVHVRIPLGSGTRRCS